MNNYTFPCFNKVLKVQMNNYGTTIPSNHRPKYQRDAPSLLKNVEPLIRVASTNQVPHSQSPWGIHPKVTLSKMLKEMEVTILSHTLAFSSPLFSLLWSLSLPHTPLFSTTHVPVSTLSKPPLLHPPAGLPPRPPLTLHRGVRKKASRVKEERWSRLSTQRLVGSVREGEDTRHSAQSP